MGIPHPIPYQGSKRKLAEMILRYIPDDTQRLIEPFAGSAAISIAAAYHGKVQQFLLNDLNVSLMVLWDRIIHQPFDIVAGYQQLWERQHGQEKDYYAFVRDEFNRTRRPDYFLYLLARCVKAAVRYNTAGDFNQSADNRRKGAVPDTMRRHIVQTSQLLSGKTTLRETDYREVLATIHSLDVVYLDPPYQGTSDGADGRYFAGLRYDEFVDTLKNLNQRGVAYILSHDGQAGAKKYGKPLSNSLGLTKLVLNAGRSSQATLLGRDVITYESLYLSPSLITRLDASSQQPTPTPLPLVSTL
ncbi:MAG: DNA adenine methylase [Chloroflexi bacterium]|nr:DNA adenine methylase [Chloroflexota bacterium]